ncbi:retropepsin-like aspartic protease [Thermoflavifilum thermophilum]|uniref:retropepsin-like aspartic protease n=1 Tax=Thermoflavifilum thermophilum TaxID=1393122 RepID=UPI000ABE0639|nr:retropepsin-like aspartic protease [Thermoflavifilum thermophilum]
MNRFPLFISLILSIAAHGKAGLYKQQDTVLPARLVTTLPFHQFVDGVLLVRASIALHDDTTLAKDTLNFILDTGSGGISIDSTTAAELHLPLSPSDVVIHGIGGSRTVPFVYDMSLLLPHLRVDHLNFHVNNYDMISALYGIHIDGIIGYSFLSQYIVRIDYDQQKIWIYTPGQFAYPEKGFLLKPLFAGIPIIHETLASNRQQVKSFFFSIPEPVFACC